MFLSSLCITHKLLYKKSVMMLRYISHKRDNGIFSINVTAGTRLDKVRIFMLLLHYSFLNLHRRFCHDFILVSLTTP